MKKFFRKLFGILGVLSTGIAFIAMLVDYFYIPWNLKPMFLAAGAFAMVCYIVMLALEA